MTVVERLRRRLRERAAEWARRRQGPDDLPVTLSRRRLYILPTRAGMAFAALVLTMLLAGLNYANSLALLLGFLLVGFALVAMNECHRNLLGVSLVQAEAPPLFAGSAGIARLTLENAAPRFSRYRVEAADRGRSRSCSGSACPRPRTNRHGDPAAAGGACTASGGCDSAARIPSACSGSGPGFTRLSR